MNKLLLALLLLVAPLAHADDWTGADKTKHFAVGAAISSTVLVATKNEGVALLAGCGAGAYIGGKGTGFVLRANGITYTRNF